MGDDSCDYIYTHTYVYSHSPCGGVEHLGELHDDLNGDLNDGPNDDGGHARWFQ